MFGSLFIFVTIKGTVICSLIVVQTSMLAPRGSKFTVAVFECSIFIQQGVRYSEVVYNVNDVFWNVLNSFVTLFISATSGKKCFSFLEMRSQKPQLYISVCLQKITFIEYAREPLPSLLFLYLPSLIFYGFGFGLSDPLDALKIWALSKTNKNPYENPDLHKDLKISRKNNSSTKRVDTFLSLGLRNFWKIQRLAFRLDSLWLHLRSFGYFNAFVNFTKIDLKNYWNWRILCFYNDGSGSASSPNI